jgi:Fe-S-cluster containining protein
MASSKPPKKNTKAKSKAKAKTKPKMTYDCVKCIGGFCCSFPVIELNEEEACVMAEAKGMSRSAFKKKYLLRNKHKPANPDNVWIFKHKKHPTGNTKTICVFFVKDKGCSMYESRPHTCREWGSDGKCNIYDFLASMRKHTDDPTYVPTRLEI